MKRFDRIIWTTGLVVLFSASSFALFGCDDDALDPSIRTEVESDPPVGTEVPRKSVGRAFVGFNEGELAGDRATLTIKGTEFAFRYCPAGEFMMGSPEREEGRDEDETQHKVVLTKGYWLMEAELTQAQWEAITGENPSHFKGENLPVEQISWDACEAFVRKLNEELGASPAGWRFSLPTEAQWEYACRAGTTTAFSFGDSLNGDKANCNGNYPCGTTMKGPYLEKTSPARSYPPNAWGFYDMHGNVYEWCLDYYGEYPQGDDVDPTRLDSGDDYYFDDEDNNVWEKDADPIRVFRGGSWNDIAVDCRSAIRDGFDPDWIDNDLGARLALVSTTPD